MLSNCEQNDSRNQKQQIKIFLGISLNHLSEPKSTVVNSSIC